MMKLPLFAALACAALALPASAGSWTATGSNGATASGSRTCDRSSGSAVCSRDASVTSAGGQTATRTRTRISGGGTTTMAGSATGPQGNSRGWSGTFKR